MVTSEIDSNTGGDDPRDRKVGLLFEIEEKKLKIHAARGVQLMRTEDAWQDAATHSARLMAMFE